MHPPSPTTKNEYADRFPVYFASFLATLNCRDVLRAKASQPVTLMLPVNTTLTAVGYGGVMPGSLLSRRCEDSLTTTPRLGSPRSSPRLRRIYTVEGGSPRLVDERTLRRMGSSRSVVRLHECAFIGKGDENLKVSFNQCVLFSLRTAGAHSIIDRFGTVR